MKTTLTIRQISLSLLFVFFLIGSCRYKDGPNFTLRSATARVTNVWLLNKLLDNGADQTAFYTGLFPNYTLTIKKDKTYSITSGGILPLNEVGTWAFNDAKTEITFFKNTGSTSKWLITKLKTKELFAEQTDNKGHLIQYRLIAK